MKLEPYCKKSGTEYYTFLGRDAVEAIKAYLADMRTREVQNLISVNPKTDVEEIEAKPRGESEQQNPQRQILVNNLATGNTDLRDRIQIAERKLVELEKLVKEVLET